MRNLLLLSWGFTGDYGRGLPKAAIIFRCSSIVEHGVGSGQTTAAMVAAGGLRCCEVIARLAGLSSVGNLWEYRYLIRIKYNKLFSWNNMSVCHNRSRNGHALVLLFASIFLTACGGGGGSSDSGDYVESTSSPGEASFFARGIYKGITLDIYGNTAQLVAVIDSDEELSTAWI